MMNSRTTEDAQRACLKQSFGAALSTEEQELLKRYLETPAGEQYNNDSNNMKDMLSTLPVIGDPVDSAHKLRDFESMLRTQLVAYRRKLPWILFFSAILPAAASLAAFYDGAERLQFLGWAFLAMAIVLPLAVHRIGKAHWTLLDGENLLQGFDKLQQRDKRGSVQALRGILLALLTGTLAFGIAQLGGEKGLLLVAVLLVPMLWAASIVYTANKRKDRELWDWWEGRDC